MPTPLQLTVPQPALEQLPSPSDLPAAPLMPDDIRPATPQDLLGTESLGVEPLTVHPLPADCDCICVDSPFGYNLRSSSTSWLLGGGNQFGIFTLESLPTLKPGEQTGVVTGIGLHWLSGPVQTDLPPRLFDFQIGWQRRKWLTESLGYDVAFRVGAFSDFEGSAREGIRFPSHGVGFLRLNPACDLVFGVDYVSRDDIKLLPVIGLVLKPRDDLRIDLVFPRPCLEWQYSAKSSLYLAGELGGGSWAIERMPAANDVVTYRDYRLLLGLSSRDDEGGQSAIEFGYIFGRDISYRSGQGDYSPIDTLVIQLTQRW